MEIGFIFVLILLLNTSSLVSAAVRSSYGEQCNKTQKCDRKAWLSCVDGLCDCTKADEMLFDEEKGKCLTKSGERCKYGFEGSGEAVLVEMTDCVQNAICSTDGLCVCDNKHHEIFSGLCAPSKLFGDNCTEANECSLYEGLKCLEGTCQCNSVVATNAQHFFPNNLLICIGLSGKPCIRDTCVLGATCSNNQCICDTNYFHNSSSNTCVHKYKIFETCSRNEECLQSENLKLSCVNGICDCNTLTHAYAVVQKFEVPRRNFGHTGDFSGPAVAMCAPKVGQLCPLGYCVSNAKCAIPFDYRYYHGAARYSVGNCECSEGYESSHGGSSCAKGHGNPCGKKNDCVDNLECSDGVCSCPFTDHQTFDNPTKSCISVVGAHCTNTSKCVSNAFCKFFNGSTSGICECNSGFVADENRNCDVAFGQKCSSSLKECDSIASLVCLNNLCACRDKMYSYTSRQRKCLGLVGANCQESEKGHNCVPYAECFKESIKSKGICQCKNGFVVNPIDYTCEKRQEEDDEDL